MKQSSRRRARGWPSDRSAAEQRRLRVPEITALFWIIKGLSTAMGESTSDYLVHAIGPVPAVLLGFSFFLIALAVQFSRRRYLAWSYWFAVCMVGVFGTMAADVLHVGFGVPYYASSALYGVALAAIFLTWQKTERTLSIHSIDRFSREAFYWMTVVATFALGTAVGDLSAVTLHLGYFLSAMLFTAVICIPAIGYWRLGWNAIFAFWFAYVITRPLGASFADWMGKPKSAGGLGWGAGPVAAAFAALIVVFVAYLTISRRDVIGQRPSPETQAIRRSDRSAVVYRSRSRHRLVVRLLVWLLFLAAVGIVTFAAGYLLGSHFLAHLP
jgi:uncharacterized membrane-anchored protein